MGRKRWLLVGVAALLLAALSGVIVGALRRADPVQVTNVPTPTASEFAACRKLAALLPATIGDGLKTRTVRPSTPLVHAWGTPAAVLRCGVGYPPNLLSGASAGVVGGISWFSTDTPGAVIYTTVDREPRVSLAIPLSYQISGDLLSSLTDAVGRATTLR